MAERMKQSVLERERLVDVICGPDAYRDLPRLLATTSTGDKAGLETVKYTILSILFFCFMFSSDVKNIFVFK